MNRLLSYLTFWWYSKNEHGVHSPFVFDLVTKCFYDTNTTNNDPIFKKIDSKTQFLLRLGSYFKYKYIYFDASIKTNFEVILSRQSIVKKFNTIEDLICHSKLISKSPCLICVNINTINTHTLLNFLKQCHRDSVVLIPSIRKNKINYKSWNQLNSSSEVSVSIDTYYWGLLFFRTEQLKEHFTIRL